MTALERRVLATQYDQLGLAHAKLRDAARKLDEDMNIPQVVKDLVDEAIELNADACSWIRDILAGSDNG